MNGSVVLPCQYHRVAVHFQVTHYEDLNKARSVLTRQLRHLTIVTSQCQEHPADTDSLQATDIAGTKPNEMLKVEAPEEYSEGKLLKSLLKRSPCLPIRIFCTKLLPVLEENCAVCNVSDVETINEATTIIIFFKCVKSAVDIKPVISEAVSSRSASLNTIIFLILVPDDVYTTINSIDIINYLREKVCNVISFVIVSRASHCSSQRLVSLMHLMLSHQGEAFDQQVLYV